MIIGFCAAKREYRNDANDSKSCCSRNSSKCTVDGDVPRAALPPALIAKRFIPDFPCTSISSLPCDHLIRLTFFANSSLDSIKPTRVRNCSRDVTNLWADEICNVSSNKNIPAKILKSMSVDLPD